MMAKSKGFIFICAVTMVAWSSFLFNADEMSKKLKGTTEHESIKLQRTRKHDPVKLQGISQHNPCSLSQTSKPVKGIKMIRLPEENFTLLHIGKAGGGTFNSRFKTFWKIDPTECHPFPCPHRLRSDSQERALFAITIRDPVDRFVSAFYWRSIMLCNPDGDLRTPWRGPWKGPKHPENYCQGSMERPNKEQEVLFHKYKRNVNLLAEALCDQQEQVIDDVKRIGHAQSSIGDWLGDSWKSVVQSLRPIVLEKGFDLNSQIDDIVSWVNSYSGFVNASDLAVRNDRVHLLDCNPPHSLSVGLNASRHSSASQQPVPLSSLGEKCLAHFYRHDYEILKELMVLACKSKDCESGIQSILDRRAPLLSSKI